ncbi:MAG: hypothetical protein OHK0015_15120 [Chloroflexi bacterium OHK40]|jgi:hypothetical protein
MSRPVRPRRSPRIPTLVLVAVPLFLIALAIGVAASRPKASATMPPPEQAAVPHFVDVKAPGEPRTVVVGGMTDSLPGTSNEAGYLMTNLRAGQIPEGATTATVLTDTNCEPDADGVSHCLNDLQIGNVVVTVQHHHQMHSVPCLSPGETVTLMPFEQYEAQL